MWEAPRETGGLAISAYEVYTAPLAPVKPPATESATVVGDGRLVDPVGDADMIEAAAWALTLPDDSHGHSRPFDTWTSVRGLHAGMQYALRVRAGAANTTTDVLAANTIMS